MRGSCEALARIVGRFKRGSLEMKCPVLFWVGSPGRTRTCDQPVNSRLLYQLSYRGMIAKINAGAFYQNWNEKGDTFLDIEVLGVVLIGRCVRIAFSKRCEMS